MPWPIGQSFPSNWAILRYLDTVVVVVKLKALCRTLRSCTDQRRQRPLARMMVITDQNIQVATTLCSPYFCRRRYRPLPLKEPSRNGDPASMSDDPFPHGQHCSTFLPSVPPVTVSRKRQQYTQLGCGQSPSHSPPTHCP